MKKRIETPWRSNLRFGSGAPRRTKAQMDRDAFADEFDRAGDDHGDMPVDVLEIADRLSKED